MSIANPFSSTSLLIITCVAFLSSCKQKEQVDPSGFLMLEDSTKIFYNISGNEDDTVLVPLNYWNIDGFKKYLPGKTIIFYDPRGRRQSDSIKAGKKFNIHQDIEDLEAIRQLLGIRKMHLIGTSYYAALVARYAMLYPGNVKSLVMVGSLYPSKEPFINYDPPELAQRIDSNAARRLEQMKNEGWDTSNPVAYCEQYWKVNAAVSVGDTASLRTRKFDCDLLNERPVNLKKFGREVFETLGDWNWQTEAGIITARTLIIHGSKDLMVPLSSSEKWASIIPGATLKIIDGAGHVPWWEFEQFTFEMINSFYNDLSS